MNRKKEVHRELCKNLIDCIEMDSDQDSFFGLIQFIVSHIELDDDTIDCVRLQDMLQFIRLEFQEKMNEKDKKFFTQCISHIRQCNNCKLLFIKLRYSVWMLCEEMLRYPNTEHFFESVTDEIGEIDIGIEASFQKVMKSYLRLVK